MRCCRASTTARGTDCWRYVRHLCMYKVMTTLVAGEVAMEVTATQAGDPWSGLGVVASGTLATQSEAIVSRWRSVWARGYFVLGIRAKERVQDKAA